MKRILSGLYTSASEVIRDGLRLLFEKDVSKQQQLEILREEVGKGFQQLSNGQTSDKSALDIFADVSKELDGKL